MATAKKSKANLRTNNTTGYLGVTVSKATGKFIAQYKGKKVGRFAKAEEAARARDARAFEVDGDKAILNFPKSKK